MFMHSYLISKCIQDSPTPIIDTIVIEDENWRQMQTIGSSHPEVNCIWRSNLESHGAEEKVHEILADYKSKNLCRS